MSNCVVRVAHLIAVCVAMLSSLASPLFAQTDTTGDEELRAAQDIEACSRNLKQIYEAILAYQRDNKDIPNWLSDLVPQYINSVNVLVCPICRRTGKSESAALSDPKLPSCYLYEFCPVPLETKITGGTLRTRREWKRRQMALVGTMIPIVRCRQHGVVLNLAYDGRIYQSPAQWESLLTNHINIADLTPEHIFGGTSPAPPTALGSIIPRDPSAKSGVVDLSGFYNAALTESWHGGRANNDLAALPTGLQRLAGVDWDIRGIVQLASKGVTTPNKFPVQVTGIKIGQKCQRLHFLHSAGYGHPNDEGSEVGVFVVHYAANRLGLEIPIRYGQEVRNWHSQDGEPEGAKELTVAWTGQNAVSTAMGQHLRLFKTTWTNPFPDIEIETLDYVSRMTGVAPFLIAITAE